MSQRCMVLIAAPDLMPKLKARAADADAELLTFSDTDALRALEAILKRRPDVVTLERLFSATPRGIALINRIKADPTLTQAEIRIISQEGAQAVLASEPAAAPAKPAPAKPVTTPPAPSVDVWSGNQPRRVDSVTTPAAAHARPVASAAPVATPSVRSTPSPVAPSKPVAPVKLAPPPAAAHKPIVAAPPAAPPPPAAVVKPIEAAPPAVVVPPVAVAKPVAASAPPKPIAAAPVAEVSAVAAEPVADAMPVDDESPVDAIHLATEFESAAIELPVEWIEAAPETKPAAEAILAPEAELVAEVELIAEIELVAETMAPATAKAPDAFEVITNAGKVVALEPPPDTSTKPVIEAAPPEPEAAPAPPAAAASAPPVAAPPDRQASPEVAPPLDQKGTRRAPRFKIAETAGLLLDGTAATLVDLSRVGVQVLSKGVLKPNQRVRMALTDKQGAVKVSGSVAWALFEIPPRYRAGIAFLDADPAAIDAFCDRHKQS